MIDDVARLRPHVKTHKSPDVTRFMLNSGITKFKCATIAEAEMLGMVNAPDVLLAYQPEGPKLSRFIDLIIAYPATRFSCLVDNEQSAESISQAALSRAVEIAVYIDLNVGMNRTGVVPQTALALYQFCYNLEGIQLIGLHAYDGHIHDSDYDVRIERSADSLKPVFKLIDQIREANFGEPLLIAGGSPTYPILAKKADMECSPGTFAYWDRGYQMAFPEQPFQTAALVVGRVISIPQQGRICIDIGHKSVSAENDLAKRIYFLNAPDLVFTGHSEEHLVADVNGGDYHVGDVLYGLPYHICPTVALYERAVTVENNKVTCEWKNSARDRRITI